MTQTPRSNRAALESIEMMNGGVFRECKAMEIELNAANERIQRLEKAGEDLATCAYFMGFVDELNAWRKALKGSQ